MNEQHPETEGLIVGLVNAVLLLTAICTVVLIIVTANLSGWQIVFAAVVLGVVSFVIYAAWRKDQNDKLLAEDQRRREAVQYERESLRRSLEGYFSLVDSLNPADPAEARAGLRTLFNAFADEPEVRRIILEMIRLLDDEGGTRNFVSLKVALKNAIKVLN